MDAQAAQDHKEREHFFSAAKRVAALTLGSRVLGMVRDMAITSLGATRATGAFVMAFQIPNLFRRLFGEGALAGAFVPVFTETQEASGFQRAARLFANALGLLAVFLLALMLLVQAGLLGWAGLWPGEWDRRLLVGLLVVMMPFMVTVCLLALCSAALNCRGRFAFPAAAPILLNVFIIAAAWGLAPALAKSASGRLYVLAGSVVVAGAVQIAIALALVRRSGFAIRPRLRPVEPGIRPMLKLMAPMLVGLGFLSISPLFDSIVIWVLSATEHSPTIHLFGRELARPLAEGTQVQVYAAQRLYQLPMGVLAISLGVAVFPLLSRYAARGDMTSFRDSLNRAIRLATMEGLATGVGLFMLAEAITCLIFRDITWLIFRRRAFTAADVSASAWVLKWYAVGMLAYCAYQIFSRVFFALKQPKTPLVVSSCLVVVGVALVTVLVWVPWLGAGAFGAVAAFIAFLNAAILGVILRRRLGPFGGRKIAASVLRSVAASGTMAAALYALLWLLRGRSSGLAVAVCVPVGAAVFFAVARALRAPELGELFGALAERLRRKPAQGVSDSDDSTKMG
ncbi:MAG TPA: murein biosynthesis integral membrane protein MurJ [Phycisphaerae bacterium]|nr:murein biosynthesis integral membrane protein MurJ [Phycisphaerae bacterium]